MSAWLTARLLLLAAIVVVVTIVLVVQNLIGVR